jgi:hypothetical protein
MEPVVRELTLRRERDILSLERRLHPVEDSKQMDREMANTSYALYEKCSAKVVRLSGLLTANGEASAVGLEPGSSEPSAPSGTPCRDAPRAAEGAGAPPGEAAPAATTTEQANDEAESEGYFSTSSRP